MQNRVEDWIKDWRLSPAESRDLYLDTAALLRTNKVWHDRCKREEGNALCLCTCLLSVCCVHPLHCRHTSLPMQFYAYSLLYVHGVFLHVNALMLTNGKHIYGEI